MILARHAASMFWVGRYLERAEGTARSLETETAVSMHLLPGEQVLEWRHVLSALGAVEEFDSAGHIATQAGVVGFLLWSRDNQGSVVSSVGSVRENLRVVRDRVPVELWEEANRLFLVMPELERSGERLAEVLLTVRRSCQAMGGVLNDGMMRDEGHAFIVLGRLVERLTFTVDLLRASAANVVGGLDSTRVLRLTNALQAFRRRHGHDPDPHVTTQFLLFDPDVPRSVLAVLTRAEERLAELSRLAPVMEAARRRAGMLRSWVEFGDVAADGAHQRSALLDSLSGGVRELADDMLIHSLSPVDDPAQHVQYVRPGGDCPASATGGGATTAAAGGGRR